MNFGDFLAQQNADLKHELAKQKARNRALAKSRDRQRAARTSVRYCASCTKRVAGV